MTNHQNASSLHPSPFLIAVGGGSGSGKTTIVEKLRDILSEKTEVLILSQDNYYKDLSHLSFDDRTKQNFDHPHAFNQDLMEEHLIALKMGNPIDGPIYDFKNNTQSGQTHRLDPKPVIIFDGIMSLYFARLRELFDFTFYVDVPDDVRILRRIQRDTEERGRTMTSVIGQYLSTVKEMHQQFVAPTKWDADLIVGWNHFNQKAIDRLTCIILNSWQEKLARNIESIPSQEHRKEIVQ